MVQGILIKGGDALERGAAVNVVVFDKTGTLTFGRPIVVGLKLLSGAAGRSQRQLQTLVGSLEAGCEHPVARALLNWAAASIANPDAAASAPPLHAAAAGGDTDWDAVDVPGNIIQVRMRPLLRGLAGQAGALMHLVHPCGVCRQSRG